MFPGREVRAGSCRKTPEINGTWKQYSGRKFFGFFSGGFQPILVLSGRNRPEIRRKKSEKFPTGILLPCSGYFRCFLQDTVIFPAFSCRFLQYPVAGTMDLGMSEKNTLSQNFYCLCSFTWRKYDIIAWIWSLDYDIYSLKSWAHLLVY